MDFAIFLSKRKKERKKEKKRKGKREKKWPLKLFKMLVKAHASCLYLFACFTYKPAIVVGNVRGLDTFRKTVW